jgi:hypothetical protein
LLRRRAALHLAEAVKEDYETQYKEKTKQNDWSSVFAATATGNFRTVFTALFEFTIKKDHF